MRIADRTITPGRPPYIIAEIGVNHDGDPARALALTEAAAEARADAIKLQLFKTDRLMGRAARLAAYQRDAGETDPFAMLRRLELPIDAMAPVVARAHALGLHAIVTVFSLELVPLAERLPWDAYKTASPDIVHRPLLEALAATDKPLIVSTGAADPAEIARARAWLDSARDRLAFLHCVSSYPTPPEGAHLAACRAVAALVPPCPVGYSDHTTLAETGAVAAAHAGALILEKHLTDDRTRPGPDHAASLEPHTFAEYVRLAHHAHASTRTMTPDLVRTLLGEPEKRITDRERDVRAASRQSITAARNLPAGHTLTAEDLRFQRPGLGLEPWRIHETLGRTITRPLQPGDPITPDVLESAG